MQDNEEAFKQMQMFMPAFSLPTAARQQMPQQMASNNLAYLNTNGSTPRFNQILNPQGGFAANAPFSYYMPQGYSSGFDYYPTSVSPILGPS